MCNGVLNNFTDINECDEGTDVCAQNCIDTEGSYNCSCGIGYTLATDELGCNGKWHTSQFWRTMIIAIKFFKLKDNDECAENADNCEQVCLNTVGSFDCGCNPGYELTSDGRTCQGIIF